MCALREPVSIRTAWGTREAIGATSGVCAVDNIVEHFRVLVQNRVDETNWALAHLDALLVDPRHQGREDWRRGTGAA